MEDGLVKRATRQAGRAGGFVAVAAFSLPYNLGLATAAVAGIAAGLLMGRRS